jgi:hypothetical protein
MNESIAGEINIHVSLNEETLNFSEIQLETIAHYCQWFQYISLGEEQCTFPLE